MCVQAVFITTSSSFVVFLLRSLNPLCGQTLLNRYPPHSHEKISKM